MDKEFIERVQSRPGLYGLDGYRNAYMFLVGYDQARSGGLLRGFTEWLIVRKGECSGFGWQALILDEALSEIESNGLGKLEHLTARQEQECVDRLLALLLEFLTMRDDALKLAQMYAQYASLYAIPEGRS